MQNTDLSLQPYFDDFNEDKNFYKVLFKPNYPVQARELTTLQSILQTQIEKFGQHIFKEGSVVIPGQTGYNLQYNAVLVNSTINGVDIETIRPGLVEKTLTGQTTNVKAKVAYTISATESEKATTTLYVVYTSSGNVVNGVQLTKFANDEVLLDESNNPVARTTVQNATEFTGSAAYITDGVYFLRGFFVNVPAQTILLDQYDNYPSYKVGLNVIETIETAETDPSLYDNAIGSTNFTAPGADRLKVQAILTKQDINFSSDESFTELLRLKDGKVIQQVDSSVYNELERNLARRTYDESGNYTINDINFRIRETYNDGKNNGVYNINTVLPDGRKVLNRTPVADDGDAIDARNYYTIELDPLKAYVRGFEVDNTSKKYLTVEKPRTYLSLNNQGVSTSFGNYFTLKLSTLQGGVNPGTIISLERAGTQIGKCRALALVSGGRLFVADLTLFATLTISSSTSGIVAGDFIFVSNGSQAVVDSVSGSTISVSQISGEISSGLSFTNSRNSSTFTITTAENNKIENITKLTTNSGFSCDLELEEVSISGSSFVVSNNIMTGSGTRFSAELKSSMKLNIGGSFVTISTLNDTSVTVTGTLSNGTYYNVKKLVPKLQTFGNNFFSKLQRSIKSTTDMSYYKALKETKTVNSGSINISTSGDYAISTDGINVTNSSGLVQFNITSASSNNVNLSVDTGLNGTTVNVFYKIKVNNPSLKTKSANKFNFLSVTKSKSSTNTIYGTRIQDREISLKFPDVYKIHAIHEAVTNNDANTSLFDSLTVNDASRLSVGDIIAYENVRAKIISINGTTLHFVYIGSEKFTPSNSLALSVKIISDIPITGKVVTSVTHGSYKDITSNFSLVKNDGPEFYNISKLVLLENRAAPTNKFIVVFDYYNHSNTSNDFYASNSYDVGQVNYSEIPSTYEGTPYTDIIDFRYETSPSAGTGGTLNSPYEETNSAFNYYSLTRTISNFAFPGEIVSADYDYYLGRIDKVYLDENNTLIVSKGSESANPQLAQDIQNSLLLGIVNIPPYMKNVSDASVVPNECKRYTMQDISSIDKRLEVVENLTSLNLLEVNTNNLTITDDEGNNRFKTGFLVDNFKTTDIADQNNVQYNACIDSEKGLLRPYPIVNNNNLIYDTANSTCKKTGNIVTLPYDEIAYVSQVYASRVENLQPFEVVAYVGEIYLNPPKDIWFDTVRTEGTAQQIDLTEPFQALFDRTNALANSWNQWQQNIVPHIAVGGGGRLQVTPAPRNNPTNRELDSAVQNIEVGDTINSVVVNKFIRSRVVDLGAVKLKPNTYFHFFVNDIIDDSMIYPRNIVNMTDRTGTFIAGEKVYLSNTTTISTPVPGGTVQCTVKASILGTYSNTSTYLSLENPTTVDESQLNPPVLGSTFYVIGQTSKAVGKVTLTAPRVTSNSNGILEAFVIIPPSKYEIGRTSFKLCDDIQGISVFGISQSNAEVIYDTQGTTLNITSNVLAVDVPIVPPASTLSLATTNYIPPPPPPPRHDPIAQSFFVDSAGGIFISSIDLYFQSKDDATPVVVDIRTMENGTLTETIVPYSITSVAAADVKVSSDASVATRFTFPSLVYLNQNSFYAFVVRSDSKKYNIWVSRLSENDVQTSLFIDKQPYTGSLFKSQNMSTWTEDQFEDVKFTINRARFNINATYTCKLNNSPVPAITLNSDALKFTSSSALVQVYQPNHGMNSIQNYVTISNVASEAPNTILNTAITSGSQLGNISLGNASAATWSTISGSAVSVSNPGYVMINNEIIKYSSISGNVITISERGVSGTTASSHSIGSQVKCYSLNGIPLTEINTTHKITEIVDFDSYKITTANKANLTLNGGGNSAYASRNLQFEELYPNINSVLLPSTEMDMSLNSVTGNALYATSTSFSPVLEEPIENREYSTMSTSRLIASPANQSAYFSTSPSSLTLNIRMSTTLDNLSPFIDIPGSSVTTVSNRISRKSSNGVTDISAELTPYSGKYSAYVTKKVVLENSSTSIKVLLDGIRYQGVGGEYPDIKVFAKILPDANLGLFNDMNYIEIPATVYPTSSSQTNYRSFEFEIRNVPEFKEYSIKVCMIGQDQTNIPKIKNFRAIALAT
jgi:hypothetical protein